MSHNPSSLVLAKGAARFSRIGLLVALVLAALPLAYGGALWAFGVQGAAGFVAGEARSFVDVAAVFVIGWVVTGWLLATTKRDTRRTEQRDGPSRFRLGAAWHPSSSALAGDRKPLRSASGDQQGG